jgi:glycosyltransferase involved in cell wall biosynthesis
MKVSIITVVFNAEQTIADALRSVASQTHKNIEHIVVDGASSDATLGVIQANSDRVAMLISEPDKGIYDAMNKGLKLATGEVIGLLNADDILQDESVISQVVAAHADQELDACYADLVYVKQNDLAQVTRTWRSRDFRQGHCFSGWMPAHPTLYLKRRVYDRVGNFNTDLRYQADLEFCVRAFELHSITSRYIPKLWVRMRLGGVTNNSLRSMVKGNWESYLALRKLGLKRDPLSYFLFKFGSKLPSFLRKN